MSKSMTPIYTCRICLIKNDKGKGTKSLSKKLFRLIKDLSGIELKPLEYYPNRICIECLEMLEISLKFRDMCRSSANALLGLAVAPILKIEPQDTYEENIDDDEDENITTIKSDINSSNFFRNFVDCRDVEAMSEIADFSMDGLEVKINENERSNENNEILESKPTWLINKEKVKANSNTTKDQINTEGEQQNKLPSNRGRKKNDETGGNNNIMCEICGNIYKQRNLLNMHMRRHMEYKPFDCEICGKSFTASSEIRRHMRIHTGEKPFVCKFCGRSFADRSTHIKHERTHTNTRPFQCTTCGKSFTYSNVLKNHMLTHTGEKNFHCLPCNKTFSRKHQLDQHCATITHQQTIKCLSNTGDNVGEIAGAGIPLILKSITHQQTIKCLSNTGEIAGEGIPLILKPITHPQTMKCLSNAGEIAGDGIPLILKPITHQQTMKCLSNAGEIAGEGIPLRLKPITHQQTIKCLSNTGEIAGDGMPLILKPKMAEEIIL